MVISSSSVLVVEQIPLKKKKRLLIISKFPGVLLTSCLSKRLTKISKCV